MNGCLIKFIDSGDSRSGFSVVSIPWNFFNVYEAYCEAMCALSAIHGIPYLRHNEWLTILAIAAMLEL